MGCTSQRTSPIVLWIKEGNLRQGQQASVCTLSYTFQIHTHPKTTEASSFKISGLVRFCVYMTTWCVCVCVCNSSFSCEHMGMFTFVCGLCKMFPSRCRRYRSFSKLTDLFLSWTQCSWQSAGFQWQPCFSKALLCFDSSAVKRGLMPCAFCGIHPRSQSSPT